MILMKTNSKMNEDVIMQSEKRKHLLSMIRDDVQSEEGEDDKVDGCVMFRGSRDSSVETFNILKHKQTKSYIPTVSSQ